MKDVITVILSIIMLIVILVWFVLSKVKVRSKMWFLFIIMIIIELYLTYRAFTS
jgi:hypothetical protein